jgi:uncharacterized PurR-regulated membrane protein YhhQ (DUF165 family)
MHQPLLLHHRFKAIGLAVLIPSFICWLIWTFDVYDFPFLKTGRGGGILDQRNHSLVEELIFTGLAAGLLMIAFSREKIEDEYIMTLRLQSLQWAVLVNSLLLVLATWIFYGEDFLKVMIYNMLTVLIIFVIRFQYMLYSKKSPKRTIFSLPPRLKKIGLLIVIACIIAYVVQIFEIYDFPFLETGNSMESSFLNNLNYNWIDEILTTGMTVGLIFMTFAREKSEDEFIVSIRLRSLQAAVLLNYGLLFLMNWFFFEGDFVNILIYNMFTVLIIFVIWFNITLRKTSSSLIPE